MPKTAAKAKKTKKAKAPKKPKLPALLEDKLYKTGMTRGADANVIYQNRVLRSATVLIPYAVGNVQRAVEGSCSV